MIPQLFTAAVLLVGTFAIATASALPDPVRTGRGFIENKGQVADTDGRPRPDVLFTAESQGARLFFTSRGVSYVLTQSIRPRIVSVHDLRTPVPADSLHTYRVDLEWVGAGHSVIPTADAPTGAAAVYLKSNSRITAQTYERITYRNLYPFIDLVFYHSPQGIKYDFIIHPGGKPADVRFAYRGAERVEITSEGELKITTPLGSVVEGTPVTYTPDAGTFSHAAVPSQPVRCAYRVAGSTVSFTVGEYDRSKALVIDPTIAWATFAGGGEYDRISGIRLARNGDVLAAGGSASANFPTTPGVVNRVNAGGFDWVVMRIDPRGRLVWSTYLGSGGFDIAFGLIEASDLSIWVHGEVRAGSWPVTANAFRNIYAGGTADAAIARLSADGQQLMYATYCGGASYEALLGAVEDSRQVMWFAGRTRSADFSTTQNAVQPVHGGQYDAVILAFDSSGQCRMSTYWGGSEDESAEALAIDANDRTAIAGFTTRSTFITSNTFQRNNGGGFDGFIAVFDASLELQWGTLLGGGGDDYGNDIATDNAGNIYVRGVTSSGNFPVSNQAFQTVYGGNFDAFLTKFSPTGDRLWTTFFGGTGAEGEDTPFSIQYGGLSVDSTRVLIGGKTQSQDLSITTDAFQSANGGAWDAFIAQFTPGGSRVWASYLGGTGDDIGLDVQHRDSTIYICGAAGSADFPATPGVLQETYGGSTDGFIVRLGTCIPPTPVVTVHGNTTFCEGDSVALEAEAGFTNYVWTNGSTQRRIVVRTSGEYRVTVTDPAGCSGMSAVVVVTVVPLPKPVIVGPSTLCDGGSIGLDAGPGYVAYQWSDGQTTQKIAVSTAGTYTVVVTDTNGCTGVSEKFIVKEEAGPTPVVDVQGPTVFCKGDSVRLEAEAGFDSYLWSNGAATRSIVVRQAGTYFVRVTSGDCLGTSASISVVVNLCDSVDCTVISGVVNSYAAVAAVDATTGTVELDVPASDLFRPGDQVLLVQMQGADIATSNTVQYGAVVSAQGAGLYEFAVVRRIEARRVVFTRPLINHLYDVRGRVQVVSVPYYDHATVRDTLSCAAWNGSTGGVLVLQANCLTIEGTVDATAKGFRGGTRLHQPGDVLPHTGEYTSSSGQYWAEKGEGIAGRGVEPFIYGKGSPANGGGGGNGHNAGGAGGASSGAGGLGGFGYQGVPGALALPQGIGGKSVAPLVAVAERLFMGGGGGAGHVNHNHGSAGAAGGGIVILRAHTLRSDSAGAISARGADAADDESLINPDGCGGGGAGGTIVLDVPDIRAAVVADVRGGRGGSRRASPTSSGTGGGGGGGLVLASADTTVLNRLVLRTDGGDAGIDYNGRNYGATDGEPGSARANAVVRGTYVQAEQTGCRGCIPVLWSLQQQCGRTSIVIADAGDSVATVELIEAESNNVQITVDGVLPAKEIAVSVGLIDPHQEGVFVIRATNRSGRYEHFAGRVRSTPAVPGINWDGRRLHSTAGYRYQWSYNGNNLHNGNQQMYEPTLSGGYRVTVTDSNGCSAVSDVFEVVLTSVVEPQPSDGVAVYPNPAQDRLVVECGGGLESFVEVRDALGGVVLRQQMSDGRAVLALDHLPAGMYIVSVRTTHKTIVRKFIRQ